MAINTNNTTSHLSVWRGTWALIRYRPGFFLANVIFETVFITSRLLPGWMEKLFYDKLTGTTETAVTLWGILGIFLLIEIGRLSSTVVGSWGGMQLRTTAASLMRKNIVQAILHKPGAQPLPVPAGDAINRLDNDLADFSDFPTWVPEVVGHGLFTLVALIIMMRIAPLITLVALLPLVGVFFLNRFVWARFLRYIHESSAANSKVTAFLGEIFGAVQAVKVADGENGTMGYFHMLNEERRRLNVRYATFLALFRAATDHLGDIAVAVMVLLAGTAMAQGKFTIGEFALFSTYLFFAARFPATIGSYISEAAQERVVLDRAQALVPHMPATSLVAHGDIYEMSHRAEGRQPTVPFVMKTAVHRLDSLAVHGLSYQYATGDAPDTETRSVNAGIADISFTLLRGGFTVITGRIGSGKSTLLRALLGLLPPDEGEIRWNGTLVTDPATFFVPPRSAYTPQTPRLFSMPLRDNILMGLPEARVDLPGAIHRAVMEADVLTLENGLETVVGPRGVRLSGGQVQRAAAARMFVRNAELLVFDDLSSALDVETEAQLWQRIRNQELGIVTGGNGTPRQDSPPTCLVVSHRRAALRQADQILVLENGRIAAQGKLDDLLASSPAMQAIWHGQVTGE
ncbi:MAG: ABC transporter ATP-binding protein [Chloroflexota bacterium]